MFKWFNKINFGLEKILGNEVNHCAIWLKFNGFYVISNSTSSKKIHILNQSIKCSPGTEGSGIKNLSPLQFMSEKSTIAKVIPKPELIDDQMALSENKLTYTKADVLRYRLKFFKEFLIQFSNMGNDTLIFLKDPLQMNVQAIEIATFSESNKETLRDNLRYISPYFKDSEFNEYLDLCTEKTIKDIDFAILSIDDYINDQNEFDAESFLKFVINNVNEEGWKEFHENVMNITTGTE